MIQHPLPPHIVSTPLNQLPLASSQITSQIVKRQMEMRKFLLGNIDIGLDFYRKNQNLLNSLDTANQMHESLSNWVIEKKNHITEKQPTLQESKSIQDKCKIALRLSNLDELAKNLYTLPEKSQQTFAMQAASQLPIPTKQNVQKIVTLLQKIFSSQVIKLQVKENVLKQSFKVLIQKALKMKLDIKAYSTNRNVKHYYFDIAQIYQKSFNKTMRILTKSVDDQTNLKDTMSQIITNTYNQFTMNFLGLLSTDRSEEKTLYFLVGLKESSQSKEFLLQLSRIHCENLLKPLIVGESLCKITSQCLMKLDSDEQLRIWLEQDDDSRPYDFKEFIQENRDILTQIFGLNLEIPQESNGKIFNEISKQFLQQ